MYKIYIRNRFRVRNLKTQKIEWLAVITDKNGTYRLSPGFNTYAEAESALKVYCPNEQHRKAVYNIETYSSQEEFEMTVPSEQANKFLTSIKHFSGKGLALNVDIPKREERKYSPDKYYDPQIRFAQSVLFNKGISVNKTKQKKHSSGGVGQFEKLQTQVNTGSFSFGYCVVDSLRKKLDSFENRKDIMEWLRQRSYSVRHAKRIISQVYDKSL